ncbi:hypothetical protein [Dactylosporangium sp. CA-139066]|uniref:hypothetical protein n=1 Tax=Dactylosporangium sp. CA-139066 TaxID=3239930 RepID=UPI003D8EDDD9
MRAQPDDHVPTGTGLLTRPALAGAVTWMLFVGALTVTFAVAYGRGDAPSQRAAVYALSIAVAVALLTLPSALRRPSGAPAALPWPDRATVPVFLLLLAGSAALIGVSVSLTLDGRQLGAWALLLPAAAGPLLVLLERRSATAPAPEAGGAEEAEDAGDVEGVVDDAGDVDEVPDDIEAIADTDEAEGAQLVEETDVQEQPAELEEREEREEPEARELMRQDFLQRLRDDPAAVAVEAGCWATLLRRLDPEADEQGGVALTIQAEDTLLVLGMVFPAQVRASAVRCEFSTDEVDRVRRGVNSVAAKIGLPPGTVKMAWVHTHPRMGVFLSATDLATSAKWRSLDPAFRPIVVDVSRPHLEEQIGVFDGDGHKILPIRTVGGLIEYGPAQRLAEAIENVYHAERRPIPLVLIGRPDLEPGTNPNPSPEPEPSEPSEPPVENLAAPEGEHPAPEPASEGRHAADA